MPANYSTTFISKSYSTEFLLKEEVPLADMGTKMYNKQVCQNPQYMAKKLEIIIFSTQ